MYFPYIINFFPALVVFSLLSLSFSEVLSLSFSINGEFVYTCGFLIILYVIWDELYKACSSLKAYFGYLDLSTFWFKYKELESLILLLSILKVTLVNTILCIFTFTGIILKILNLLKFNLVNYKISTQTLNKVKLKIKALPLQ